MIPYRRTTSAGKLLALAVALLPLFSEISAGLHMLLVRHVVCRAHGEFIDADEGASGRIASSCSVTADDESAAPKLGGGNSGGAEKDEHCLLGVVTRTGFLSWRSGDEPRSILREFVACALKKRLAPEASIERILLAPKQSPPNWGSVLLQIGALETA